MTLFKKYNLSKWHSLNLLDDNAATSLVHRFFLLAIKIQRFFLFTVFTDPSSAAKRKPSKTFGFNPCSGGACGSPAVRPLVDTGAMVFVVFGILGVNRTERRDNHVIGDMVRASPASTCLKNQQKALKTLVSCH